MGVISEPAIGLVDTATAPLRGAGSTITDTDDRLGLTYFNPPTRE
jgi:hypothetical protein